MLEVHVKPRPPGEVAANADGEGKESFTQTTSQSAYASSSPERRAFFVRAFVLISVR